MTDNGPNLVRNSTIAKVLLEFSILYPLRIREQRVFVTALPTVAICGNSCFAIYSPSSAVSPAPIHKTRVHGCNMPKLIAGHVVEGSPVASYNFYTL